MAPLLIGRSAGGENVDGLSNSVGSLRAGSLHVGSLSGLAGVSCRGVGERVGPLGRLGVVEAAEVKGKYAFELSEPDFTNGNQLYLFRDGGKILQFER